MFKLIELPYSKDGLNPVISSKTLDFHHGKHLQAYVDNLNKPTTSTTRTAVPLTSPPFGRFRIGK